MKKTERKQRRKPKQARSLQKYNEILDAAIRVLNNLGYRRTTMSEIHLESGHPYATIYQYFGSKEDIFLAWLERFTDGAIFELATLIRNSPNINLEQQMDLSVRYSLEQIARHQNTLGTLLNGMALVSSQLVGLIEQKNREWIERTYGPDMSQPHNQRLLENMLTAARAGSGYWLMLVLNTRRKIDIENEVRNVTALIKALLFIQ